MYLALKTHSVVIPYKGVWDLKIPLRIKVFVWTLFRRSVLTKENLIRRGWIGMILVDCVVVGKLWIIFSLLVQSLDLFGECCLVLSP
jgi:predicted DNA-binding transcriptional regulator